MKITVFA